MSDSPSAEQLRARLSRIEGQIRGIAKMLESERPCEDVVTQLMAVRSGIDTVGALVLDLHLGACIGGTDDASRRVEKLRDSMRIWWRFAPGAAGFGGISTGAPDEASTSSAVPGAGPSMLDSATPATPSLPSA